MAAGISGRTHLCGVLGHPLDHTLSPRMHNAAFAALRLDWVYVPLPVASDRLAEVLRGLRALANFAGANVTVPHKEAVVPFLDDLTEEARAVGAVNTIVRAGDRLMGHTTDGVGLLAALAEAGNFRPAGTSIAIVGAGGAGRSAAFALAAAGARQVAIINRSEARAQIVAADVARVAPDVRVLAYQLHDANSTAQILGGADLVVNATSVGMRPEDPSLLDLAPCHPNVFAYDMVYNPSETPFLRQARARGLRATNGLGMLLH
ncbi:MAG: shikimate dehydrogenase, partial [Gemmatimonadales bacterium]